VKWVPVIEHVARLRSCYIYTLKPRRWRWHATMMAYLHFYTCASPESRVWVMPEPLAKCKVEDYRNWLGENRVGG
jgi:hypothetical protein